MAAKSHPHEKQAKHHAPSPKERELATQLTVAVLHAARPHEGSADALADQVKSVYHKMLALVAARREPPAPEPSAP